MTARNAWSRASSERARATRTIVAASGIDEDVESELGDMPPEVSKRLAELVRPLADGLVGAEQATTRRGLDGDHREGGAGDDPVQPPEPRERGRDGRPVEEREDEGREEDRRREGDGLHAGRVREPHEEKKQCDEGQRRTLEHQDEGESDEEEERIEGVLRHDGPRVRHATGSPPT